MSQRISGRRSCVVRESGQRSRAPRQSAAQENARDRARAHPARGSRRRARRFRARSRLRRSRPTRPLGHEPLRRHARTQALPSRAMSSRTRSTVASALVDGMPNLCIMGGVTAATRWPETRATRGLVATPHALASEAGVAILKRGGNAVDAAIAAATTIAVVYPHMNGVGGASFWLIYDIRRGALRALNAAGRSAAAADLDRYRARFGAAIPVRGGAAALTVPGVVSGWWEAHALSRDLLGSPIDWRTLLEDAIARARDGFPPSPGQRRETADADDLFGAAAAADLRQALWRIYHPALLARERFVPTELAFEDRDRYLADPTFAPVPVDHCLDPARLDAKRRQISRRVARRARGAAIEGDTIAIVTADADGNAVSLIQSLYWEFGSGVIAGDTGVLLQNRGASFSLDPAHPNRLAPRKQTAHTLIPSMYLVDGRPRLVYGTMGGEGQPQTQAALVTRILDRRLGPQAAVEAPRWLYGRTWGEATGALRLETRFGDGVTESLRERGHEVEVVEAWSDLMGHAQLIRIEPTGFTGASDPRADGAALGF